LVGLTPISVGALAALPTYSSLKYPRISIVIHTQHFNLESGPRFNLQVDSPFSSCVYFLSAFKHSLQLSAVLLRAVARLLLLVFTIIQVFRASPKTSASHIQHLLLLFKTLKTLSFLQIYILEENPRLIILLAALALALTFSHASPTSITKPQYSLFQHHSYTSYQCQSQQSLLFSVCGSHRPALSKQYLLP
jgi:hypothetical protein